MSNDLCAVWFRKLVQMFCCSSLLSLLAGTTIWLYIWICIRAKQAILDSWWSVFWYSSVSSWLVMPCCSVPESVLWGKLDLETDADWMRLNVKAWWSHFWSDQGETFKDSTRLRNKSEKYKMIDCCRKLHSYPRHRYSQKPNWIHSHNTYFFYTAN